MTLRFIELPQRAKAGKQATCLISHRMKILTLTACALLLGSSTIFSGEAPQFAQQVSAGKLPPLEERLPKEPLVIPVVENIGSYGGTLRRAFLGPGDHNNYTRVVYDALVRFVPDGSEVIPHSVAASASVSS